MHAAMFELVQIATLQASHDAAQYETLGREDDALLVRMLQAGLHQLTSCSCAPRADRIFAVLLCFCPIDDQ